MVITVILGIITALLSITAAFLPEAFHGQDAFQTLKEMIAGAKAFSIYFPINTAIGYMLSALAFEVALFVFSQFYRVLNWVRGSGGLDINK